MGSSPRDKQIFNAHVFNRKLLDAAAITTDGEWINVEGIKTFSFHIKGLDTGDIVSLHGSNVDIKPSSDDVQLGIDITTDDIIIISNVAFQWIKAKFTRTTSTNVSVWLEGTN